MLKTKIKNIIKNLIFRIVSNKQGFADLKILSGIAKGAKLRLDVRLGGSYWLGNYDQWIFDAVPFKSVLLPGQIAWDCGAYVGYYTAVFRKLVGSTGKVITFEAASSTYQRLKFLPKLNNWDNVTIYNLAVGPDHTLLKFVNNLGASNGPMDLSKIYLDTGENIKYEEITSCGVDELVYEKGIPAPDFIKFDLESGEEFALHNGDKIFSVKRPILLLELHGQVAKDSAGLFLEKYNYEAFLMHDVKGKNSSIRNQQDMKKIDYVPHMIFCTPL